MTSPEDEISDLKQKNCELVKEVQFWKMSSAQEKKEKFELMKELNDLRLKLSKLRSSGAAEAHKLDSELYAANQEIMNLLVETTGIVARSVEITKKYMKNRQELESQVPRWSTLSGGSPPKKDSKVNRVRPSIGGQSIQPVVALRRTLLNSNATLRSPNRNANVTVRPLPMQVLQDAYIPLTRIDLADMQMNSESDADNSTDDLGSQGNEEPLEEQNITEDMSETRRLDDVIEEAEPEEEGAETEEEKAESSNFNARVENPLEGPSWLLDRPQLADVQVTINLEPDSTTSCYQPVDDAEKENEPLSLAFTPTVRRRKRTSPPPEPLSPLADPPAPPQLPQQPQKPQQISKIYREVRVVLAKMRLPNECSLPKKAKPMSTQRRSTIDSPSVRSISPVITPSKPNQAKKDCNGARSPKTAAFVEPSPKARSPKTAVFAEPSPNGCTGAAGFAVSATAQRKIVKHRRRILPCDSDSDDSNDGRSVSDHVKVENSVTFSDNNCIDMSDDDVPISEYHNRVSENNVSAGNICQRLQRRNAVRCGSNVSESHNERREGSDDSDSDYGPRDDSELNHRVIIFKEPRVIQRGRRKERDTRNRKIFVVDGRNDRENSEIDDFRGFANSREGNMSEGHDKNKNVTKGRGKNVTNSRGNNVTNSQDGNGNNSRDQNSHDDNVTNSRDHNSHDDNVNDTLDQNATDIHGVNVNNSRDENDPNRYDSNVNNSRDKNAINSHDGNVNSSHEKNVTKRKERHERTGTDRRNNRRHDKPDVSGRRKEKRKERN